MKIQEFAKHLDEPREIGKKKQKVSSSDMKKLKNKAFEVYKEISTRCKPEKRRKLKPGEIEIMKGRGNRQTWFYVKNKNDAKTLIRLGRNTAFPTGITNNNSKDKFDKNLFIKEDWSNKYKKSIDCNNPKGFSQKAHCAGRKKQESMMNLKSLVKETVKEVVVERQLEMFLEKNVPTNPSKWSYYKSQAKKKFDVYPSAYANAWAAKQYKAAGGSWKKGK